MMTSLTRSRATLIVALFLAAGCGERTAPEEQLRQWVATMQEAAEQEDRKSIVERISPAYSDARGHSRDEIDRLLRGYFLRYGALVLLVSIDDIEVFDGTAAEVALTVGMAGTGGGALGLSADAYRFELELEADGDEWRLLSARWGELGAPLR